MTHIAGQYTYKTPTEVWSLETARATLYRSIVHAKLLTQIYPILTSYTSKSKTTTCPCCCEADETLEHFLLQCTVLSKAQENYLPIVIISRLKKLNLKTDNNASFLQVSLGSSSLPSNKNFTSLVTHISRAICFICYMRWLHATSAEKMRDSSVAAFKWVKNILN